ncbi:hypothetical protein OIU84_023937 [Salix udensis]|uniref:Uncharacterized protein n=1 Tax=Salix udensis TaxID=889485 RepID=A0AAD6J724_9ROSI|nr:hypothetical protein OIU84_023937 [Salix udensis]
MVSHHPPHHHHPSHLYPTSFSLVGPQPSQQTDLLAGQDTQCPYPPASSPSSSSSSSHGLSW